MQTALISGQKPHEVIFVLNSPIQHTKKKEKRDCIRRMKGKDNVRDTKKKQFETMKQKFVFIEMKCKEWDFYFWQPVKIGSKKPDRTFHII